MQSAGVSRAASTRIKSEETSRHSAHTRGDCRQGTELGLSGGAEQVDPAVPEDEAELLFPGGKVGAHALGRLRGTSPPTLLKLEPDSGAQLPLSTRPVLVQPAWSENPRPTPEDAGDEPTLTALSSVRGHSSCPSGLRPCPRNRTFLLLSVFWRSRFTCRTCQSILSRCFPSGHNIYRACRAGVSQKFLATCLPVYLSLRLKLQTSFCFSKLLCAVF